MKLYCASWAFLTFLFMVFESSVSVSQQNPDSLILLWTF